MASATYILLLCLVGVACIGASWNRTGWTEVINKSLGRFVEDLNVKDWASLAGLYTADAHLLAPGHNVVVGRDAIAETYRSIDSARNGTFVVENLRVTSLRYYSESWAVVEYGFFDIGDSKVGVGVTLIKMVDGELKYATDIYYEV